MKKEELKKLFSSESFIEKLQAVDSMEDLQRFLEEYGLKMSLSEINKAIKSDAELNENELKDITGGAWLSWVSFAWKCFTFDMIECE